MEWTWLNHVGKTPTIWEPGKVKECLRWTIILLTTPSGNKLRKRQNTLRKYSDRRNIFVCHPINLCVPCHTKGCGQSKAYSTRVEKAVGQRSISTNFMQMRVVGTFDKILLFGHDNNLFLHVHHGKIILYLQLLYSIIYNAFLFAVGETFTQRPTLLHGIE